MADDLTKRGKPDRTRISTTERWELDYWADKFACSEQQLRDAVDEVGCMATDVEAYLAAAAND